MKGRKRGRGRGGGGKPQKIGKPFDRIDITNRNLTRRAVYVGAKTGLPENQFSFSSKICPRSSPQPAGRELHNNNRTENVATSKSYALNSRIVTLYRRIQPRLNPLSPLSLLPVTMTSGNFSLGLGQT